MKSTLYIIIESYHSQFFLCHIIFLKHFPFLFLVIIIKFNLKKQKEKKTTNYINFEISDRFNNSNLKSNFKHRNLLISHILSISNLYYHFLNIMIKYFKH